MEEKIYEIIEENNINVPPLKLKKTKKKKKLFLILTSTLSIPVSLFVVFIVLFTSSGMFSGGFAKNEAASSNANSIFGDSFNGEIDNNNPGENSSFQSQQENTGAMSSAEASYGQDSKSEETPSSEEVVSEDEKTSGNETTSESEVSSLDTISI